MQKHFLFATAVLAFGCSAWAATTRTLKDGTKDGVFDADGFWNVAGSAETGDTLTVTPGADITVTMDRDFATDVKTFDFKAAAGKTLTFDGIGHTLGLPASETGAYGSEPFHFRTPNNSHFFSIERYSCGATGPYQPYVSFTNPKFTLSADAENRTTLTFLNGIVNAYDPYGTYIANKSFNIGASGQRSTTVFEPGTTLKADVLTFCPTGDGAMLDFRGATADLKKLTFNYDAAGDYYVRFREGTKATIKNLTLSPAKASSGARRMNVSFVDSDAVVRYFYSAGNLSTLSIVRSTFYGEDSSWSFAADNGATNIVTVVDSVVTNAGGTTAFGKWSGTATSHVELYATNSTFVFRKELDVHCGADLHFTNCTLSLPNNPTAYMRDGGKLTMQGGALSGGQWRVGDQYDSELVFDGGAHTPYYLSLGANTGSEGKLYITGGASVTCTYGSSGNNGNYVGNSGTGLVEVVDGTYTVGVNRFPMGYSSTGYGEINVHTNGSLVYSADFGSPWQGIEVGCEGRATLNVRGGSVVTPVLTIGYAANAGAATSVVNIVSGTVTANDGNYDRSFVRLANAAHNSALYLGEGELRTGRLFGNSAGRSLFSADGGRLMATCYMASSSYPNFIHDLTRMEIGAKGLVVDSNGIEIRVPQDMTNKAGAQGVLEKTGAGTMKLSSASYDVAKTVVSGGTLQYLNTAPTRFDTSLAVKDGGVFSMAGAVTTLTINDLTVSGGILEVDPGDKLVVKGTVSLKNLKVRFTSLPTVDEMATFFSCTGRLDAASAKALRNALADNNIADGTHLALEAAYDEQTDKTTVTIGVKTDLPSIGAEGTTSWSGTTDVWGSEGNWSAGVPGATKKAEFASPTAVKTVTAPATSVGALAFGDDGYTLQGGPVAVVSEQGEAEIAVVAGSHEVSAPLSLEALLNVPLAEGTSLKLSGKMTDGGIKKTGTGHLTVAADNDFIRGVQLVSGITTVETEGALGASEESVNDVRLRGGVLETTNAAETAMSLMQNYNVSLDDSTGAFFIRTDVDTTMNLAATKGCTVKYGPAPLSLVVTDNMNLAPTDRNAPNWAETIDIDANGAVTPAGRKTWGALNVAEGELRLHSDAAVRPRILANSDVIIGLPFETGTVDPVLSLQGVYFRAYAGSRALRVGDGGGFAKTATLRVVDADVYVDTFRGGESCTDRQLAIVAMTNATMHATYMIQFSGSSTRPANTCYRLKDTALTVGSSGYSTMSGIDFEADNTTMGGANGVCRSLSGSAEYTTGQMAFRNGSVLHINGFSSFTAIQKTFALLFEDSIWDFGTGDFALDASKVNVEKFSLKVDGTGLIVSPASGKTLTLDVPVVGAGGFVNRGAGTVAFAAGRCQFTGKLVAESGVIDLTNAGTVTNAVIGAGAGVVRGGTFHNATIALDAVGGTVPNFENCTFTGVTRVTIGGEPAKATGVAVAKYTGTLTGVGTFRLKGWKGYRGVFTAKDGEVTADIDHTGLMLIVR